jgi:hypothetical protein
MGIHGNSIAVVFPEIRVDGYFDHTGGQNWRIQTCQIFLV